jgi:hypothetical protein
MLNEYLLTVTPAAITMVTNWLDTSAATNNMQLSAKEMHKNRFMLK